MTVIFQIDALGELEEISQWLAKRKIVVHQQMNKKSIKDRVKEPDLTLGDSRREGIQQLLQFVRSNKQPKVTKIEIPNREERNER